MDFGCYCVWLVGIFVVYKIADWLIRKPFIRGRLNRYILVTGCDTGFGYEITKRLDKNGYNVFAGCLTEKGQDNLKKQCSDRLKTFHLNVTDGANVRKAYDFVKKSLPDDKGLWGVLNNAGIAGSMGPSSWMRVSDFQDVLDVNLLGLIDVSSVFLPLVKKEKGRVVNTASVMGRTSLAGVVPYSVSKYGVEAFTDALRRELREYGCRAILIEPGFFKTEITNPATVAPKYNQSWERLSPELKEEYGEDYRDKSVDLLMNGLLKVFVSERISDVVDAYENALLAMFPRARYVVGVDAKYVWLPIQWMPEWLGDFLLDKAASGKPTPAVLMKKE